MQINNTNPELSKKIKVITALSCLFLCLCLSTSSVSAQCSSGELEVFIDVQTDDFGYETYWQLVPSPNPCGTGTLFAGGNTAVGCNGAGLQNQTPGGYGNNITITEGPWCLLEGNDYVIDWVDDWGDGGTTFTVIIDGFPVYTFIGDDADERFTFKVEGASDFDVAIDAILTPDFAATTEIYPSVQMTNRGTSTVNTLDISYSIDGGTEVSATLTGLSIAPFVTTTIASSELWNAPVGTSNLSITLGDVNGNADANSGDNTADKDITVSEAIPNIVDLFVWQGGGISETMATSADGLNSPRDLDFHPDLSRSELWVVNEDTEGTGSSTLTIEKAGKAGENMVYRRDGNAWHFMNLATAIAFSDNGNFANS
ncbi:MAG: hypothetical protein ACI959_000526, partial [Limisphaerales bacterium]